MYLMYDNPRCYLLLWKCGLCKPKPSLGDTFNPEGKDFRLSFLHLKIKAQAKSV